MYAKQRLFIQSLPVLILIFIQATRSQTVDILTDANFEHLTQASTGATTGKWLVVFHNHGQIPKLDEGEEDTFFDELQDAGIVLGTVDVSENAQIAKRFGVFDRTLPHAIVLSKGELYRTDDISALKSYAMDIANGYGDFKGEPIPPPESLRMAGNGLHNPILLIGSVLLFVAVVLVSSSSPPSKDSQKKKKSN